MKKSITIALLFLAVAPALAQTEEVVNLMNEVRTDPQAFLKTRLLPYLQQNNLEENSFAKSLVEELKTAQKRKPLQSLAALEKTAKAHALDMGKHGTIGHNSSNGTTFENRLRKKFKTGMIAENCDYGNATAIDIVMALLIDDGIASLGHRKNILRPELNYVGIAIEKHKTYETNCVMDFSQNN